MIEQIGHINMDYMVRLSHDPVKAKEDLDLLQDFTTKNGVLYGGQPVPVPLKPHFVSPKQERVLHDGVANTMQILEKFTKLWLEDERLQAMWGTAPDVMDLLRVDPGYSRAIPIARLDGFLKDYRLQFLEFNCDSPGGTGYADIIHDGFQRLFERNGISETFEIGGSRRLLALAGTLKKCYAEWRQNGRTDRPEAPFTVVTDWNDVGTMPDIEITIDHLRSHGLDAVFADPRDLTFDGEAMYFGDRKVDLVYKRVIVRELAQEPKAAAVADAYRAGAVCLVNSPRSIIVGNKKILAALKQPGVFERFTTEQRAVIRAHIPWTEVLRDAKVDFNGFVVNLEDFVLDNKDKLVLKAAESYGGKDVLVGFETDPELWAKTAEAHMSDNSWVVQELVEIPKELFPVLTDTHVELKLLNININPLAFSGEYGGSFSRVSERSVINVSFGGGLMPSMSVLPRHH